MVESTLICRCLFEIQAVLCNGCCSTHMLVCENTSSFCWLGTGSLIAGTVSGRKLPNALVVPTTATAPTASLSAPSCADRDGRRDAHRVMNGACYWYGEWGCVSRSLRCGGSQPLIETTVVTAEKLLTSNVEWIQAGWFFRSLIYCKVELNNFLSDFGYWSISSSNFSCSLSDDEDAVEQMSAYSSEYLFQFICFIL